MGVVDLPINQLDGREVILDGYKGELIGNPSETVRQRYENTIREQAELIAGLEELKDLPCITADKHRVHLWVNTGLISDVARSLDQGGRSGPLQNRSSISAQ